jgi:hypothetical protein
MTAKIQPLPSLWNAGTQRQVVVRISSAPAGQTVEVDLFLTVPEPERHLGHEAVNVGDTGSGMVALPVTLTQPGVNVLHCEAVCGGDFDSDSAGTLVQ